jgi:hypothetical protein
MAQILTLEELKAAYQQIPGVTADVLNETMRYYEGARFAAEKTLPQLPQLGFFSSSDERVNTFMHACVILDDLVALDCATPTEAFLALYFMMFSDKSFKRAMKAFGNRYYRARHTAGPTSSKIANHFIRCMA